jgi:hypothetical protein
MGVCTLMVLLVSETLPPSRRAKFDIRRSHLLHKVIDFFKSRFVSVDLSLSVSISHGKGSCVAWDGIFSPHVHLFGCRLGFAIVFLVMSIHFRQ